ncbi:hypothetical protein Bxe_C0210 [Paraburkholderia xenovorans LB400]|uniref:Uncharacterized protein n=1 Tax=Paraburkholderia xenovorans (strain LB400) TaxID=266265 RepID=Q13IF5_PARXL|nr:hypothetical protein Bxe_C0210 [Paraburkholderia xenovorans LB400]
MAGAERLFQVLIATLDAPAHFSCFACTAARSKARRSFKADRVDERVATHRYPGAYCAMSASVHLLRPATIKKTHRHVWQEKDACP